MTRSLILVDALLAKSHVAAYTKKDGTFVAEHDDKRRKHADVKPEHLYGMLADAEDSGGRAAVHELAHDVIKHRPDLERAVRGAASDVGHSLPELVSEKKMDSISNNGLTSSNQTEATVAKKKRLTSKSKTSIPAIIEVNGKPRPTVNSKGQAIHTTEEGVRNFWEWFGDSKVVDGKGKPLVVYHGTFSPESIESFDMSQGSGMVWTTSQPNYANEFTGKESGAVYQLHVRLDNPLDARKLTGEKTIKNWKVKLKSFGVDVSKIDWEIVDFAPEYGGKYNFYDLFPHAGNNNSDSGALDAVKSAGFDGFMAPAEEGMSKKGGFNYVAFHPTQIKSATGNSGKFDAKNPDMTKSNPPFILFVKSRP